ncbi:hypothetical protein BKE56_015785 [Rhodococcus sp. M8]|nr:hypothetical protein BKE56_015785 [Rhodococcus sp. M8]
MSMGWTPVRDDIVLTSGDWIFARENRSGDFPPGTTAEVKWANGTTWPATIDGAEISWRIEAAQAALIPDGTWFEIFVRYPNNLVSGGATDDHVWRFGRARRIKNRTQ